MNSLIKGETFWAFGSLVCCQRKLNVGHIEGNRKKERNRKKEGNRKKSKKSRTVPKKIVRGDPSVSSPFANARKSFWLKQWLEPVNGWVHCKSSKVCTKKWYIRDQVSGLTKKKKKTRRERLKSALYLRLKMRKRFLFGKKLENFQVFFRKCRIVPKNVKGGPFGFY